MSNRDPKSTATITQDVIVINSDSSNDNFSVSPYVYLTPPANPQVLLPSTVCPVFKRSSYLRFFSSYLSFLPAVQ
jgi:hypothetical protein